MNQQNPLTWYPIPGYEGYYEINILGRVRSVDRYVSVKNRTRFYPKKYIKNRVNNCGYVEVRLTMFGKSKSHPLHRLLAICFIPNPDNKPEVNHLDGNKLNNTLDNFEWVDHAGNIRHAYTHGLIKKKLKAVIDTCLNRNFESARHAAQCYNINYNTMRNYLNGNITNPTCLRYKEAA